MVLKIMATCSPGVNWGNIMCVYKMCEFFCECAFCVCVCVSISTWWAWKHVAGFLRVGILAVLLFQPVFSMANACSMASNSPLAHDRVVDTSSGQGSSQVGVAIPPVHQKAYKWCKAFCVCVWVEDPRFDSRCGHWGTWWPGANWGRSPRNFNNWVLGVSLGKQMLNCPCWCWGHCRTLGSMTSYHET